MLEDISSGKMRVIDLSYAINDKLVRWPGDEKVFEAEVNASIEKDGYFTRSFWTLAHYGTHLDAPVHFAPGKTTVDQLPVARVEEWEKRHQPIPEGAIVLLRTGWSARWPDAERYRNEDAQGRMHFPGFSVDAAKLLIERKVSGLGCDSMSVDYGASADFAVHHLALGSGLYHLENLADLSALPETGALLVVAPIKLEGGSGGPVRVFALLP